MRSPLLFQWVQCIDSRAGRSESQLIFPETPLSVVIEAMLNSSSWLKLMAVVSKVLRPLGNTRCCDSPGQGTRMMKRTEAKKVVGPCPGVSRSLVDESGCSPKSPERSWRNQQPLPTASYFKVGIATPNNGHPKAGWFTCSCQQINVLVNSESTECKWSLCDRFSGIFSSKDTTFFSVFTSQSWLCLGHISQRKISLTFCHQYCWHLFCPECGMNEKEEEVTLPRWSPAQALAN